MNQSLEEALRAACEAVGITVPKRPPEGRWTVCPVVGKSNSNTSGRVMIFAGRQGGVVWNWATGERKTFRLTGADGEVKPRAKHEIERERNIRVQREGEQREVERICAEIVRTCRQEPHPYLERKGFVDELGLVHDDPRRLFPSGGFGEALMRAMPEFERPLLVIPGRIGKVITTVQFVTADGVKKNIFRGKMDGASHRIATGAETWVCEGIATALTVRAALRLLGRSATVLSAFSASNAAKVAASIPGAFLAADHDKPIEQFDGLGTGEFYAKRSGQVYTIPPVLGDFNDYQSSRGLRAVALHLREVRAA